MNSSQADGRRVVGSGNLTIQGVGSGSSVATVDFSGIASTINATAVIDRSTGAKEIRFSSGSKLGEVDLQLVGGAKLALTAAQAAARDITGSGEAMLTQLGALPVDLSGLRVPATAAITTDVSFAASTKLPDSLSLTIADGYTLSLSASQATTSTGAGRSISDGTGSASVTILDLGAQAVRLDSIQVDGVKRAVVPQTATLNASANLGGFGLQVSQGATLLLPASASKLGAGGARSISGAGFVQFSNLTGGLDLSATTTGLAVNAPQDLSSVNLYSLPIRVDGQGALTLTAAQASGRTITGSGGLTINDLASKGNADFSRISGVDARAALVATPTQSSLDFIGQLGSVKLDIGERFLVETNARNVDGGRISGDGRLIVITGQVSDGQGGVLSAVDAIRRGTRGALAGTFDLDPVDVTVAVDAKVDQGVRVQGSSDITRIAAQVQPTQSLALTPETEMVTITLTADQLYTRPVDDLTIDAAPLKTLAAGSIELGFVDGSQRIRVGNPDPNRPAETLSFTSPLILNSPAQGGSIGIYAAVTGTELKIYGSHATTELRSDVTMSGSDLIDDSIEVYGPRSITSGTGAVPGDILVTGFIEASTTGTDSLALVSNGGDVTVGGSVNLDAMTIDLRRAGSAVASTLVLQSDITISGGTLTILVDGGDLIEMRGKLSLLGGAQLRIQGTGAGNELRLTGGFDVQSPELNLANEVGISGIDKVVFGRVVASVAQPADNIAFTGVDTLNMAFDTQVRPQMLVVSDAALATDRLTIAQELPAVGSPAGTADAFSLRGVDLKVQTAGLVEVKGRMDLLGGATLSIEANRAGSSPAGVANRVTFASGLATDAAGETQRAVIKGFADLSFGRLETASTNVQAAIKLAGVQEARLAISAAGGPALSVDALAGQTLTISKVAGSAVTLENTRLQVSGSTVQVNDDLRLRTLDARDDAAGSLVLRGNGDRTVTLTENRSTSPTQPDAALLLRATSKLEVQETLTLKGSGGGDAIIRPASGSRVMVIGSGLFNTTGSLHVDMKDGFADTVLDFGRLILGSASQTADILIGERTTATRTGLVFADPVEVRVATAPSPVKVVTQGRIFGESLTVAAGGLFQSSGSTLDFSENVRFDSAVQIVGNTVIESKTIDFNALVTGASAPLPDAAAGQPVGIDRSRFGSGR